MTRLNGGLTVIAAVILGTTLIFTNAEGQKGGVSPDEEALECSPCTTQTDGLITHDWTLACCSGGGDCYEYPDATQYGNGGSCPGMHRPCTAD